MNAHFTTYNSENVGRLEENKIEIKEANTITEIMVKESIKIYSTLLSIRTR